MRVHSSWVHGIIMLVDGLQIASHEKQLLTGRTEGEPELTHQHVITNFVSAEVAGPFFSLLDLSVFYQNLLSLSRWLMDRDPQPLVHTIPI